MSCSGRCSSFRSNIPYRRCNKTYLHTLTLASLVIYTSHLESIPIYALIPKFYGTKTYHNIISFDFLIPSYPFASLGLWPWGIICPDDSWYSACCCSVGVAYPCTLLALSRGVGSLMRMCRWQWMPSMLLVCVSYVWEGWSKEWTYWALLSWTLCRDLLLFFVGFVFWGERLIVDGWGWRLLLRLWEAWCSSGRWDSEWLYCLSFLDSMSRRDRSPCLECSSHVLVLCAHAVRCQ